MNPVRDIREQKFPASGGTRFLASALTVALAAILQLKLKPLLGWSPDLLLVALIAASFHLKFLQFLFLDFLGVWFLNWRPGLGGDMLFYAALPVAAFFLRPLLPWRPWFVNLALEVLSIAAFYLGTVGYEVVAGEADIFWENIFWSSVFGFAAFKIYDIASR